jgi:regulator of cell morphogenesis and NO signaling
MEATFTLDVTLIEPKLKHPTIFEYFDKLNPGECLAIENDHDPKPLYYELIGERGNIFTWTYTEKGPEWWIVEIAKNPSDEEGGITIGAIAAEDIRKAELLKSKGIDFACGGNKTLKQAGAEAGFSEEELLALLNTADTSAHAPSFDYNQWEVDFLADFIVNTHHRYIKDNYANLKEIAQKVSQQHSDVHPELNRLQSSIQFFMDSLHNHILKEEKLIFPAIKEALARKNGQALANPQFEKGFLKTSIQLMQKEHEISNEDLTFFRKLTADYQLPDDACNSYRYLFEKMQEFESDLQTHIHLENNILFPKALKLED